MDPVKPLDLFNEFYSLASPLYPKLEEQDFKEILNLFQRTLDKESGADLIDLTRMDTGLKRTFFASPLQKKLYLSLKTKDIIWINKGLSSIRSHPELSKIFGFFTRIGLKYSKETKKHFKPLLCFEFTDTLKTTLVAKISRHAPVQEDIEREMSHRWDYNKLSVPALYHSHYYRDSKHIEISQLMLDDLFNIINEGKMQITRFDKWKILYQIAEVLTVIHEDMKIHGDVKTENIFICIKGVNVVAKLGDFEHCRELQELKIENGIGGTFCYSPPEVFEKFFVANTDNQQFIHFDALDIWSFGWVIYRMLYDDEPEWLEDIENYLASYKEWTCKEDESKERLNEAYEQYRTNMEAHINSMEEPPKSDVMRYLLWRCWKLDPKERITAKEITTFLSRHV